MGRARCARGRLLIAGIAGAASLAAMLLRLEDRAPLGRAVPELGEALAHPRALRAPATRPGPDAVGAPSGPEKPAARESAQPPASVLPAWLVASLELEDPAGEIDTREWVTNQRRGRGAGGLDPSRLDAAQLDALRDLVERNGLHEASSPFDYDDGDGELSPWELGFQAWRDGKLVALALGPDPYWSFGYGIDELPPSIANLGTLELLDLHANELAELAPEIGGLEALRSLYLQHNRLAGIPEEIGGLRELRTLALGGNELHTLPDALRGLERLERLYLDENPLGELPQPVTDLAGLRSLSIARSGARGSAASRGEAMGLSELPAALATLPRLEVLHVAGNRFGCGGGAVPTLLANGSIPHVYGLGAQGCSL